MSARIVTVAFQLQMDSEGARILRTNQERGGTRYMSSNQPIASPEPLSLPHFDEEATLLSARPVVPLHEVRAETRSKRRLIFASAIVAAVMVGAIGASLFFIPDKQTASVAEGEQGLSVNPVSDSSQPSESGSLYDTAGHSTSGKSPVGPPIGQEINSGESAALTAVTDEHIDQTTTATPTSRKSNVNRGQSPRTVLGSARANPNTPAQTTLAAQNDDADVEMDERMLRREERREARRLRQERRNSRERSSDDLMRIREIFEGAPRP